MENVSISGNIGKSGGKDPELRVTTEGKPFLNVSVAVTRWDRGLNGGKGGEVAIWYSVTFWEADAERAERAICQNGAKVLAVSGKLMQRSYTSKDGRPGVSLEIKAIDWSVSYNSAGAPKRTDLAVGNPLDEYEVPA